MEGSILSSQTEKSAPTAISQLADERQCYQRRRVYAIITLLLVLAMIIVAATSVGSTDISFDSVWRLLFSRLHLINVASPPAVVADIILDVRLPRVILAALVGASLAVAGATYQGLFRNPLADPYLIGVAQGAGLGATIGFLLPVTVTATALGIVPMMAFLGAAAAAGAVYLLARVGRTLPVTTLILAGVALGAFLAAVTSYLLVVSDAETHSILLWLMGGFTLSHWGEVKVLLPFLAIGMTAIYIHSRALNLMQLDEEQAQQLGVNVERVKLVLLAAATLITAAAVSFAGSIGFVGIIVPHAVRLVSGPDHRFLLPLSCLAGAVFMVLADTAIRTVLGPGEIPVGVVTAFCGAPFFLYLLRMKKQAVF